MTLHACSYPSPLGQLTLVATDSGLAALLWEEDDPKRVRLPAWQARADHGLLDAARTQLDAYFAGRRRSFALPLDPQGTAFQQKVWTALRDIGFGETRSYGALAQAIGQPSASRAVGAANGRNPLSIITPCHRVIGSSGALTGFAGGLAAKQWLLAFEQAQLVREMGEGGG